MQTHNETQAVFELHAHGRTEASLAHSLISGTVTSVRTVYIGRTHGLSDLTDRDRHEINAQAKQKLLYSITHMKHLVSSDPLPDRLILFS